MPNGESKNWIRFMRTLQSFHGLYDRWPTAIRLYPFFILELKTMLSEQDFNKLKSKIKLIADDENPFLAYDETGDYYDYARGSHGAVKTSVRAIDWLDIAEPEYDD